MIDIIYTLASTLQTTAMLHALANEMEFKREWIRVSATIPVMPVAEPTPRKKKTEAERQYDRGQKAKYSAYFGGPEQRRTDLSQQWKMREVHPANIDPLDPMEE